MSQSLEELLQCGFVATLKADVLLEASRDIEYLDSIREQVADAASTDSREHAIDAAAHIVRSLVEAGYCTLGTWNPAQEGEHLPLTLELEGLAQLIGSIARGEQDHWGFFLLSTPKGDRWVERHEALVDEL